MQARVQVDIRQVLPLLGREGFCGRTHSGHPIQLLVRASSDQEARMNIRYRVELRQTERDELKVLLSGGGCKIEMTRVASRYFRAARLATSPKARKRRRSHVGS